MRTNITLASHRPWRRWLNRLARFNRMTASETLARGASLVARTSGFSEPEPERLGIPTLATKPEQEQEAKPEQEVSNG